MKNLSAESKARLQQFAMSEEFNEVLAELKSTQMTMLRNAVKNEKFMDAYAAEKILDFIGVLPTTIRTLAK